MDKKIKNQNIADVMPELNALEKIVTVKYRLYELIAEEGVVIHNWPEEGQLAVAGYRKKLLGYYSSKDNSELVEVVEEIRNNSLSIKHTICDKSIVLNPPFDDTYMPGLTHNQLLVPMYYDKKDDKDILIITHPCGEYFTLKLIPIEVDATSIIVNKSDRNRYFLKYKERIITS